MREGLLHQLLYLMEPIGFVWSCLLVLTAALWWKRQRRFAVATGFVAAFVTVIGSSKLPGKLLESLERPYAGVQIDTLPTADAIVLLGGGATISRYEIGGVHFTPAGDRLVMAHALFQAGKAPFLLLGGNANKLDNVIRFESEIVRDLMVTWDIPKEAMIPLASNADTYGEAQRVRTLATERGWHRILLVTSANHQRRASATFRAQGLEVISVPCNFFTSVSIAPPPPGFSVPRYGGFVAMATWLHEEVGWFMYRRRGWIKE
jgi:uncharacterized SAM-binding protein YcdF (DUF218 family)